MNITSQEIFYLIFGIILGFITFYLTTSIVNHSKDYSIIFTLNKKTKFHAHHWFICLIILIIVVAVLENDDMKNRTIYFIGIGFLTGSILQGLMYKDRFRFIY